MAKRLTEDQIKWVLSVEATEAQQEIRKLTKENRELEKANKERRQEMMRLEMQGKKDTKAWKNLNDIVKDNNQKLHTNREIIRELEKTMSITELTMGQLRKRAQDLQRQLDNTSKSLNPEEYAKLEKELGAVRGRMTELRDESKKMGSLIISRGAIATFLGNIYTKGLQLITKGIQKAKEFISASTEIAAQAQGIDHAFNRIANKDYLKSLREQTKGLISDFTLMQSAVRAENFDIPLNQLGRLLEFAQNRARDTGESVDYLVNSIVDGIGRKSPLILDNLGISAVRLQEEMKKTGDFATAVGNIVEEEMAKAGPAIDTATDSATRKKVAWDNLMLSTGKYFTKFRSGWDDISTRFIEGITKIISKTEAASKVFDDQINKVAGLETEITPLVSRYEELKNKTKLTKDEQKELNAIMNTIHKTIPGVVEEFDRYGNALSINTSKVWAYIEAEKEKLKWMHRDAIEATRKDIKSVEQEVTALQNKINKGTYSKIVGGSNTGYTQSVEIEYSSEEMESLKEELAAKEGILDDHREKLKFIDGTSIEDRVKAQRELINKRTEYNKMTKKQLEDEISVLEEQNPKLKELAQEVYNLRFGTVEEEKGIKTKADRDKEEYEKAIKELEAYIAREKALIQQRYIEGKETREQYDREMEYLEMEKLRKNLEIAGLTFEQQQEIEFKLFEMKKQILKEIEKAEEEHLRKMKELREKEEREREQREMTLLQKIAAQNMAAYKDKREKQIAEDDKYKKMASTFGKEIGDITGEYLTNNEITVKEAMANIAMASLDALEAAVNIAIVEASAKSLASSGGNLIVGLAKAAAVSAAIKLAFSSAKGLIKASISKIDGKGQADSSSPATGARVITGRESGGYVDVNRAQDGKYFRALMKPKKRGFVDRPTVIVGDGPAGKSREWVASNDALENPTVAPIIKLLNEAQQAGNIRTIDLNHIMRTRMAGFAGGGFLKDESFKSPQKQNETEPSPYTRDASEIELIKATNKLLSKLDKEGIKSFMSYSEYMKTKELIEKSQNIGSR